MGSLDDFFGRLARVVRQEPQFREEAYLFVMSGLGRAVRDLGRAGHVSGKELLDGIRAEASDQFGPMAPEVLRHWGIKNSLDFGRIVFKMIDQGMLSKQDGDQMDDFKDPRFFDRLFDSRAAYRLTDSPRQEGRKTRVLRAPKLKGSYDG